ncbi:hypothetical protein [Amycolatopsis lexingtonensis]|uniref:hypothetical protein n=1 Tax=Amycolatopsis lexingtonensis TaxID=218822 RepID=UPI003F6F2B7D
MSDLFRAERSAEIRRILAVNAALLDDVLEAQRAQGRQLSGTAAGLDGLERTITDGFAELDSRIDQITRLVRQLAGKD